MTSHSTDGRQYLKNYIRWLILTIIILLQRSIDTVPRAKAITKTTHNMCHNMSHMKKYIWFNIHAMDLNEIENLIRIGICGIDGNNIFL